MGKTVFQVCFSFVSGNSLTSPSLLVYCEVKKKMISKKSTVLLAAAVLFVAVFAGVAFVNAQTAAAGGLAGQTGQDSINTGLNQGYCFNSTTQAQNGYANCYSHSNGYGRCGGGFGYGCGR
jgi:hypothetical protein